VDSKAEHGQLNIAHVEKQERIILSLGLIHDITIQYNQQVKAYALSGHCCLQ